MSNLSDNAARTVTELRTKFVIHERFEVLESRFQSLFDRRRAEIAVGNSTDARGIALSGASGTGKSCAITQLIFRASKGLEGSETTGAAIISLRVPSPATLKFLGQMILRALGYNLTAERQAWYIWDLVRHHLKHRRVMFLHLDEAQDLSSRGTKAELNAVTLMLKTLMTDQEWPVGLLLSGTEELERILNHDPQLARRMDAIHFGSLSPRIHTPDVARLIISYSNRAGLDATPQVELTLLAERLIHAAAMQFGITIEIIISAIELALVEQSKCLTSRHFAEVFKQRTSCLDGLNPFVIDDYYRIDPRKVFAREGV